MENKNEFNPFMKRLNKKAKVKKVIAIMSGCDKRLSCQHGEKGL